MSKIDLFGKAKDIYTTEDENLIISTLAKDQATAFNGAKKGVRLR